MTQLLLTAAALIALAFYALWQRERERARLARQRAARLAEENEQRRTTLSALLHVLVEESGGVAARIDEHTRLAIALQAQAPDLVRVVPDLPRWINAQDHFCKALRSAAALDQ